MVDLVKVAATPGVASKKYFEELLMVFQKAAQNAVKEHRIVQTSNAVRVNWDTATKIMASTMALKKRLEFGRR